MFYFASQRIELHINPPFMNIDHFGIIRDFNIFIRFRIPWIMFGASKITP